MSPRKGLDMNDILSAAAGIADEKGAEQITLAELAKRLNVRSPSLYNHVESLTDLKDRLIAYGLTELNERLSMAVGGREGEEALYAAAAAYMAFAREHPGLYALTIRAPREQNRLHASLGEQLVAKLLSALQPFGLETDDAVHAVRGFRSLLHGFASLQEQGGFGMPVDTDASLSFVLRCYVRGLRNEAI